MKSLWKMLAASVLFVSLSAGMMLAQGGATGAIEGVVQDASGAVIANAKVIVKNEATGEVLRQETTDTSGSFAATLLPVGTYSVQVTSAVFRSPHFPASWCASRKPRA